jgi:hypothetical protein
MKIIKLILLFLLLYFSPLLRREAGGEAIAQKILKDTTFVIVKQFQPTIADAYKVNDMPVVKDSVPPVPKINYGINSKKVFTPYTVDPIKSAKMVGEPLTKLYQSLVKVGAGTYLYGEGFFNSLRSKEYSYGAHARHLSWNGTLDGYGFSGFSDNEVGLNGKKFLHKETLSGNLDYSRNVIHYYNYDTSAVKNLADNDLIKQRYAKIGGDAEFQTHYTDTSRINYLLKLKYFNISDYYKTSENAIIADGDLSGYYENQLVHALVSVDFSNNKSELDTANSVIIGLAPYITASGEKWKTRIGVAISLEGNENDKSRFLFAPSIDFNYNVVENIIVPYAGITGGLKRNSLETLVQENPFLVPDPKLKNTNTKFELYAGIRGSISRNLSYNTHTSYSKYDDMYFFVNDNTSPLRVGFNTIYDDASLWNVHGELQFQYTEKIKIVAKGDYNHYTMDKELRPWHKPLWQTTLAVNYNLKNKIIATADLFVYGKRSAYVTMQGQGAGITVVSTSVFDLKPIIDANIGLEYRYSKKLSAFVHFNNLGFKSYELWNNYPTQKFNFLVGVTAAF